MCIVTSNVHVYLCIYIAHVHINSLHVSVSFNGQLNFKFCWSTKQINIILQFPVICELFMKNETISYSKHCIYYCIHACTY